MAKRTSVTHPILVDYLPDLTFGGPGRLGMTFAPGKKGPSVYGGHWDRDLAADLTRLRDEYGTQTLICLIESPEFDLLQTPDLPAQVVAAGIAFVHYPIVDVSVPRDLASFDVMIESINQRVAVGENVVVHCRGGLGRTGLVAACCLVRLGHAPEAAVTLVRRTRPGTIETDEQKRFVTQAYPAYRADQVAVG